MNYSRFCRIVCASLLVTIPAAKLAPAQSTRNSSDETAPDADHERARDEWFLRGRVISGKSAAALRHRAYQAKMQARADRALRAHAAQPNAQPAQSNGGWVPLGPVPLASDATGDSFQNYNQVSGRATAVATDPADPSGNTVYIGGAQGGVWKSLNGANLTANSVTWTALTDDQATLSMGAIAIQPGNTTPANSVIVVGTGEADNAADSYFGLGILTSADAGNSWTLIPTANGGALSFAGLGAARMAFSTANTNTVVAAMATSNEGFVDAAITGNTYPGLYTSTDAGQTWNYDALNSGGATEATSATSVVYNAAAGLFFAAMRYEGFYSSPDGLTWSRLSNQPGTSGLLSTTACPQNYLTTCPIYRGEITVVPGRNEMYVWFVSPDSNGNPVDQGIWQTLNNGAAWTQISDSGIANCGDFNGCGVAQGFYNLELLAVPNGTTATDLYAGAINLYKCSITAINPACDDTPFVNLTHVYGCDPLAAPAHVHPDQHAMAYMIPTSGVDYGADLMYFANDGGIYRALNGFTGLTAGSCSGTNQFDDLNQNLGSMTQFVAFSQATANPNTILAGTQDNGSPASAAATTNTSWENVLGGDGGYTAIDPNTGDFFASNPDTGSGGLDIQECASGVNCNNNLFSVIISSSNLGGDDGAFYFPYILDPQSSSTLLVGTCRVWSGPRSGGSFMLLSPNFDTLGTGTCSGSEVNTVRSLAAGGPASANSSQVIYATTDGAGPNSLTSPIGGNVWVTTRASIGSSTFTNVTLDGPGGTSINPNQFPISDVAIDASDSTGKTAYVTVMGFTGGPGHVWQTTNAGAGWIDFTGTSPNNIPDSPTNAVVIDSAAHIVYVGTDVGVFESPTSFPPTWTEVGPASSQVGAFGFLPNVAVTALALFNSGGKKLLRASTYGRGMWQFNLLATPDFEIAVSNTPLTVFAGYTATLKGALTSLNGYNNSVALSCIAGSTDPPVPCTPSYASLTPSPTGAAFLVSAGTTAVADYDFNVQGAGSDPKGTTHTSTVVIHVVDLELTAPSPASVTERRGTTSPPVSFQVMVQGTFSQGVTLSCGFSPPIPGASCAFTPGASVSPTASSPVSMTATATVPSTTPVGPYTVTLQATTVAGPAPLTQSFTLAVILNPDFILGEPSSFPNVKVGSTTTSGPISISSQDGFNDAVSLTCAGIFGPNSCSIVPSAVSAFPATATLTINATTASAGSYQIAVQGTSGSTTHTYEVPFDVGDYAISGTQTLSGDPSGQAAANLTFTSSYNYSGQVNANCDASALAAAQCTLTLTGQQTIITPTNPISLVAGASTGVTASLNIPSDAASGKYNINIKTQDTSGAPAHTWTISLTVAQDFTISSITPSSQTITPGESASYNFSVFPVGSSFTNAVSFSCFGAPAPCAFTPTSVTPGKTSAAVVMTINTTANSASLFQLRPGRTALFYALWLAFPGLALFGTRRRKGEHAKSASPVSFLFALFVLALLLISCGGGGTNGGGGGGGGGTIGTQQQGTKPGRYAITVTGISGALSHQSSPVTLIVSAQ